MDGIEKFRSFLEQEAPRIYKQYFDKYGMFRKKDGVINVGKFFMFNAYYNWIASINNAQEVSEHFSKTFTLMDIIRLFIALMDRETESEFFIRWADGKPNIIAINKEAKRLVNLGDNLKKSEDQDES